MALVNCPDCGREISTKATICVHCGYPISEIINNQITSDDGTSLNIKREDSSRKEVKLEGHKADEYVENGELLLSTKGLYDKQYIFTIVVCLICLAGMLGVFAFFDAIYYGIGFDVIGIIICIPSFLKCGRLGGSYIELSENVVSGISSEKNPGYNIGISFKFPYCDITHVDSTGNDEINIHTTHGIYKAQAFKKVDEIRKIVGEHVNLS